MSDRKAILVTVALDRDMADLVRKVADQEAEGNRSMAIRRMIREAGPAILDSKPKQGEANQGKR